MPRFECAICHQVVSYAEIDRPYFDDHGWECNICYSVIAKRRYKRNIPGGVTLFSPMSSALGDIVVAQPVFKEYLKDNPDEEVVFLNMCDPEQEMARYNPVKFWWSNVTNFIPPPDHGIQRYYLENEASEYARAGIYPALWFEPQPVSGLPERFMVFHIRNVRKAPFKNAEPMIVFKITMLLERWILAGKFDAVVLVGNDQPTELEDLPPGFIDLRNKLKVEEIAWICKHSRGFIGKDSGVAHLAAAAGAKVAAWGYRDIRWTPKAPPWNIRYLMAGESNQQSVSIMVQEAFA